MSKEFQEVLGRLETAEGLQSKEALSKGLEDASTILAGILSHCSPAARKELLAQVPTRVLRLLEEIDGLGRNFPAGPEGPEPAGKHPKELLEWARQQFTEEEILAGLHDIRTTGGQELGEFLQELEQ